MRYTFDSYNECVLDSKIEQSIIMIAKQPNSYMKLAL